MRRNVTAFAAALLLAVPLAGCGGPSDRCVDAGDSARYIAQFLDDGVTWTGRSGAVKSKDFKNVWMVALEIDIGGGDREVAVWATNTLAAGGKVFSMPGFSHSYSTAPYGPDAPEISFVSEGQVEAKTCV